MTDPEDTSTFVPLYDYPQSDELVHVTHNFGIDVLDINIDYVLAFRYSAGRSNGYYVSIDNVVVSESDACVTPENLATTDITGSSATFSWVGNASNYLVQYRTALEETWMQAPLTDNSTITINGLSAQTEYQVRVQAQCGTDVSQWSNTITFTTLCGAMNVPYNEDFDSYTSLSGTSNTDLPPYTYPESHTLPTCWEFPTISSSYPKAFLTCLDDYAVSQMCLFLSSSSEVPLFAILPEMNADLNRLMLSFTYCNEGNTPRNSPLVVGVMTDPSDTSTFRVLETYPLVTSKTRAQHIFANDATFSPDSTYHITFKYGGDYSTNFYLGIDEVEVDYVPTCISPILNEAQSVTANSALISWESDASQFQVDYCCNDDEWTTLTTTDNTLTLTNLYSDASYLVRVRAICAAGDTSSWSEVVLFNTPCGVFNLPFSENFNDNGNINSLHCWNEYSGTLSDVMNGTETLRSGSSWALKSRYQVNSGRQAANLNIMGSWISSWLVTPPIAITGVTTLEMDIARHDLNNIFDEDDKFYILATSDNGTTWDSLHSWIGQAFSNIPTYNSTAYHLAVDLTPYINDTIRIALYGESSVSGADHEILVDNIFIAEATAPVCDAPTNLVAESITDSTALLSWDGTSTIYDIEYRMAETEKWIHQSTTTNSYSLAGLQSSTTYEWRVRSNCSIISSDWTTSTFTTLESTPICSIPSNLTVEADYTEAELSWECESDATQWVVRLTYDNNTRFDTVTSRPYTLTELSSATQYSVVVKSLCSATNQSEWSEPVTFTTKSCPAVTDVMATFISTDEAMIVWQSAEASTWELVYGETVDFNTANPITTTEPRYKLTNLTPATHYEVYVRSVCSANAFSEWSNPFSFTTEVETPESIDGVEGNFQCTIYPNPTSGSTTISLQGVEGQVTISIVDMNGRTVATEFIECGVDCEKRLDVAGLAQGTYFVRILGNNINSVRKLIIK